MSISGSNNYTAGLLLAVVLCNLKLSQGLRVTKFIFSAISARMKICLSECRYCKFLCKVTLLLPEYMYVYIYICIYIYIYIEYFRHSLNVRSVYIK